MKNIYLFITIVILLISTSLGLAEDNVKAKTEISGKKIVVTVKAGKHWKDKWPIFLFIKKTTTPQVAIWIEDTDGKFIKTIYVSQKAATQGWIGMGNVRRKSSLPYWAHRRGVKYKDGLYMPTKDKPLVDAITGATPKGDFSKNTSYDGNISNKIKIFAEFNSSGNFNEDYPEDKFFGQPSVIYSTTVDLAEVSSSQKLKIIGHGHPKGDSGELFPDLNKLTTALNIVEKVDVQVKEVD